MDVYLHTLGGGTEPMTRGRRARDPAFSPDGRLLALGGLHPDVVQRNAVGLDVDAVLGRDVVQVPPECGLRVIQLTEAAWESAEKEGVPVAVKL